MNNCTTSNSWTVDTTPASELLTTNLNQGLSNRILLQIKDIISSSVHVPEVSVPPAAEQEHVLGRGEVLGLPLEVLGPAGKPPGAGAAAVTLAVLVQVDELVQGTKRDRSAADTEN